MEIAGLVLLALVGLGGAIGMGRWRRRELLRAAQRRPDEDDEGRGYIAKLLGAKPSLLAPDIDWDDHR